jgi:hypothetical protein
MSQNVYGRRDQTLSRLAVVTLFFLSLDDSGRVSMAAQFFQHAVALIAYITIAFCSAGGPWQKTASSLVGVAWRALLARNLKHSLAASDPARATGRTPRTTGDSAEARSDADHQARREAHSSACRAGRPRCMPVEDTPRSRCGHVPRHQRNADEHGEVHGASELRSHSIRS